MAHEPLQGAHNERQLLLRAAELHQQGQLADAEPLYRQYLAQRPDDVDAQHALAMLQLQVGQVSEAATRLKTLLERAPEHAEAQFLYGKALVMQGESDAAAAHFEQAVAQDPGHLDAHVSLAQVQVEMERTAEAENILRRALALAPDAEAVLNNLGTLLADGDKVDEGVALLARALDNGGAQAATRYNYANALKRQGRLDQAVEQYRQVLAAVPKLVPAHFNLAATYLERGETTRALGAADRVLQIQPGHCGAIAARAFALRERGENAAADRLVDFDRLIRPYRPIPREATGGERELLPALAEAVRNHPSLEKDPAGKSTRQGMHTASRLFHRAREPFATLEGMVRQAVESYRRDVPIDPSHAFARARPDRYRLVGWAIVLPQQGYQTAHIHPSAWLSGVFYVSLPPAVTESEGGWIEFGEPDPRYPRRREHPTRRYRPEEGLLYLFPSYFWHRTVPYENGTERISIAFDVLPAD